MSFDINILDSVKAKIPELENSSKEEEFFEATEAKSHADHKKLEASQAAVDTAKQKIRKLEIENQKLEIENDDLAMLGPHRRRYSWCILAFVVVFVLTTFVVLFMSSYQIEVPKEGGTPSMQTLISLDNKVLMTLLATNTFQVVGLLYVVAKWLFPSKVEKKSVSVPKD